MRKRSKQLLLITLLGILSLYTRQLAAQESSPLLQNVQFGFGLGSSFSDSPFEGFGYFLQLGYQKDLKRERLRLNYRSTFNFADNTRSKFMGISAGAFVDYDLIRYRRTSIFIGGGPLINFTTGRRKPYVDPDTNRAFPEIEDSFFNLGLGTNIGFRFAPKNPGRGLGFELLPINIHFNTGNLADIFLQFRFYKILTGK